MLEADADSVGVRRFVDLVRRGRRDLTAGRVEAAAATLGLWLGDVLANLTDLGPVRPVAMWLAELRLGAVAPLASCRLRRAAACRPRSPAATPGLAPAAGSGS